MQEHIFRNGLHDGAVLWDFYARRNKPVLKVIHKFGSYILAVDKPTGVINIPERYIIDKFCTDIDLDTVKGIKQYSSESGIKFIKIIDTLECCTRL